MRKKLEKAIYDACHRMGLADTYIEKLTKDICEEFPPDALVITREVLAKILMALQLANDISPKPHGLSKEAVRIIQDMLDEADRDARVCPDCKRKKTVNAQVMTTHHNEQIAIPCPFCQKAPDLAPEQSHKGRENPELFDLLVDAEDITPLKFKHMGKDWHMFKTCKVGLDCSLCAFVGQHKGIQNCSCPTKDGYKACSYLSDHAINDGCHCYQFEPMPDFTGTGCQTKYGTYLVEKGAQGTWLGMLMLPHPLHENQILREGTQAEAEDACFADYRERKMKDLADRERWLSSQAK